MRVLHHCRLQSHHRALVLILAAAAPLGLPKPCQAQPTADVAAKLELLPTSSMCSITLHQALDFAQVESPGHPQQQGSVTLNPTAAEGIFTAEHVTPHGVATVGAATVQGSNVAAYTVAIAPEFSRSTLRGPGHTLDFAGAWAHADQAQGPYEVVSGTVLSVPGPGKGQGLAHHLRFGGTISGITVEKSAQEYSASFTVTVTCS